MPGLRKPTCDERPQKNSNNRRIGDKKAKKRASSSSLNQVAPNESDNIALPTVPQEPSSTREPEEKRPYAGPKTRSIAARDDASPAESAGGSDESKRAPASVNCSKKPGRGRKAKGDVPIVSPPAKLLTAKPTDRQLSILPPLLHGTDSGPPAPPTVVIVDKSPITCDKPSLSKSSAAMATVSGAPEARAGDTGVLKKSWDGAQFTNDRKFGAGVVNAANSCFAIAVLQLICYIPMLARYVMEVHVFSCKKAVNECVACALRVHHISKMFYTNGAMESAWFYPDLMRVMPQHVKGTFEDSHEFIRLLLDKFEVLGTATTSIVQRVFGGLLKLTTTCRVCGTEKVHAEDSLDFSVPIGQDTDISSLLWNELKYSFVEGFRCDTCQKIQDHERSSRFIQTPEVLLITLNRFDKNKNKIKSAVRPETVIDIGPMTVDGASTKYVLCGVIEHLGDTVDSGHYICFNRSIDGRSFYKYDDARVCRADALPLTGYIFAYVRTDTIIEADDLTALCPLPSGAAASTVRPDDPPLLQIGQEGPKRTSLFDCSYENVSMNEGERRYDGDTVDLLSAYGFEQEEPHSPPAAGSPDSSSDRAQSQNTIEDELAREQMALQTQALIGEAIITEQRKKQQLNNGAKSLRMLGLNGAKVDRKVSIELIRIKKKQLFLATKQKDFERLKRTTEQLEKEYNAALAHHNKTKEVIKNLNEKLERNKVLIVDKEEAVQIQKTDIDKLTKLSGESEARLKELRDKLKQSYNDEVTTERILARNEYWALLRHKLQTPFTIESTVVDGGEIIGVYAFAIFNTKTDAEAAWAKLANDQFPHHRIRERDGKWMLDIVGTSLMVTQQLIASGLSTGEGGTVKFHRQKMDVTEPQPLNDTGKILMVTGLPPEFPKEQFEIMGLFAGSQLNELDTRTGEGLMIFKSASDLKRAFGFLNNYPLAGAIMLCRQQVLCDSTRESRAAGWDPVSGVTTQYVQVSDVATIKMRAELKQINQSSSFLQHVVCNSYHDEQHLVRYMKSLVTNGVSLPPTR